MTETAPSAHRSAASKSTKRLAFLTLANGRRYLAAILLFAAIALGGGYDPIRELIVELIALLLLVLVLARPLPIADRSTGLAYVLIALIVLLPLVQLIPLPPGAWESLPGREIATRISTAAGLSGVSRPLSLDPDATWLSTAALLPPIAIFLATLQAGSRERRVLAMIVALGALCSVALGLLQTQSPDLYLFRWANTGLPVGLFANRNHQAAFLAIGMLLTAALAADRRLSPPARIFAIGCIVVLALGVIVTRSRSGAVMMAISVIVSAALLTRWRKLGFGRIALVIGVVAVPAILIVTQSLVAHEAVTRFHNLEDLRPVIWRTTWGAIQHYWPAGSGFGTFVPVYQMYEQLDDLGYAYVNHAHSDYLEILLEGGLAAIALLLFYLGILATRLIRAAGHPLRIVAAVGIVLLLAHSLVDYPLRMSALATTFALLNAFLFEGPKGQKHDRSARNVLT
jgi:O-antigen ligase